jgi:hypothetical protein
MTNTSSEKEINLKFKAIYKELTPKQRCELTLVFLQAKGLSYEQGYCDSTNGIPSKVVRHETIKNNTPHNVDDFTPL